VAGTRRVKGDVVISADGAFSAVRKAMQKQDRFNYSQDYLEHGYKELHIPPGLGSTPDSPVFRLEKNALHIWPRKSFMMIALPNADGSFTCTLFWPFEGENSFASIRDERDLLAFFNREFPDAVPLMPALVEDYFTNPTGSLVTVRCSPWHVGGRVVLLGDAAHAVVPFYGQGMNAAFEDVMVLDECLRKRARERGTAASPLAKGGSEGGDRAPTPVDQNRDRDGAESVSDIHSHWEHAFARFESIRKPNADALADLAIGNFLEMRDKTGSKLFLLKKKGEKLLAKLLPGWYLPLYSMVTFTRIPYADAVARAKRQNKALATTMFAFLVLLVFLLLIALR
jgi:kynurenine 3-monooxygenase